MDALRNLFPHDQFALFAVVLGMPLLGAFINGVFGKRLGREAVRLMALASLFTAFAASVLTFVLLPSGHEGAAPHLSWTAWRWFSISGRSQLSLPIDVAFSVDAMSATMMLVVTGVGSLIHLYASEYMKEDPGYYRFFAYLNLFCFAMLVLIMADNVALLFVGWEGVGMCSYLLIGFWFDDDKNALAGQKAFVVNRIGDFGLLLAIALLVYHTGAVSWSGIEANAHRLLDPVKLWPIGNFAPHAQPFVVHAATLAGLAIFLGCAGKSAQIPLYIWLPDAMAGPTPVSALIHAATMVTAGVYLIARLSFVFVLSPFAMATVMVVGAMTAFFAASIGLFQRDLKKVLAYSTVSQLGFMFIGVGAGAFAAGFFHVFTHAFFKACLFLGAGSVIHAMHVRIHDTDKSQDMRNMGGLKKFMPLTRWTFLISCLAIAGVPPLSGFWSKDEILWKAYSTMPTSTSSSMWQWPTWLGPAVYWVGIASATMTAFYMFRAYYMTFEGPFRGWTIVKDWKDPHHGAHHDHGDHEPLGALRPVEGPEPHESPLAMTLPLLVLATFAALIGFVNAEPIQMLFPSVNLAPLGHMLEPVFAAATVSLRERVPHTMMLAMMVPGLLAAVIGIGGATFVYLKRGGEPERAFALKMPGLYKLVVDKWRIDELYAKTVLRAVDFLADTFAMGDKWIIDGLIAKLTAVLAAFVGTVLRALQTGRVQVYSAALALGILAVTWFTVSPHAGATVNERQLRSSGDVTLTAAPGLGYRYRWEGPSVNKEKAAAQEITVNVKPGDKTEVTLVVRNMFERETRETFSFERKVQRKGEGPTSLTDNPSTQERQASLGAR